MPQSEVPPARAPRTHVVILDGTMSSIARGQETNAGLLWKLLAEAPDPNRRLYYEPGIQWRGWSKAIEVMAGIGLNRQIKRAYQWLAAGWQPGDRVYLFGYSRGAYAVRSLSGVIDRRGLLRPEHATHRLTNLLYQYYQDRRTSPYAPRFTKRYCWPQGAVEVEMIGVWDTVKALGLRVPVYWRWSPPASAFHHDDLVANVHAGYHALAHDERRMAYAPVLWQSPEAQTGRVEQVWFPGTHGDVGGQVARRPAARGLSNFALVWMLRKAVQHGLRLPDGWADRFPANVLAPSVGMNGGFGILFQMRARRVIGTGAGERVHRAVYARQAARPSWLARLYRRKAKIPEATINAMPNTAKTSGNSEKNSAPQSTANPT